MNVFTIIMAATFWTCGALVIYTYAIYPALLIWLPRWFGRSSGPPDDPEPGARGHAFDRGVQRRDRHRRTDRERAGDGLPARQARDRNCSGRMHRSHSHDRASLRGPRRRLARSTHEQTRQGRSAKRGDTRDWRQHRRDVRCEHSDRSSGGVPARTLVPGPSSGGRRGALVLSDPRSGRNADSLYWRYETFLKRCEARLGAMLGANGAIYAIRRELLCPHSTRDHHRRSRHPLAGQASLGLRHHLRLRSGRAGADAPGRPLRIPPPGPDRGRWVPEHRHCCGDCSIPARDGSRSPFYLTKSSAGSARSS